MKKTFKCGIVAAVAVAAGFAAYQSYGSYGLQDNSLLMQNIEALAADDNQEPDGGDPGSGQNHPAITCYKKKVNKGIVSIVCPEGTHFPDHVYDCPPPEEFVNPKGTKDYCWKQ